MVTPEVNKMNLAIGKVIFSFDFEIGWGDITNGVWQRRQQQGVFKKLRTVLPEMLKMMDSYEIPAEWATVGAMVEQPGERDFSHLTDAQLKIVRDALEAGASESFDGTDLFEMVLSAKQEHSIACHSYTHIPFNFSGVDRGVVSGELERFERLMKKYGVSSDFLVFPENKEGYHAEVKDAGYRVVRVQPEAVSRNRYLYLASVAFLPPPAAKELVNDVGLIRHYGSMLYFDASSQYRMLMLKRRLSLGLANAVKNKNCLHIWAHPFNFAESDALLRNFDLVLSDIARLRDRGELEVGLV